jgi:voltage-gated potassium channel
MINVNNNFKELSIIEITFFRLTLAGISLTYLYAACSLDINFISGMLINLFCLVITLVFRSYSLFYINLILTVIISCRYYCSKKDRVSSSEFINIFIFNLVNICLSVYGLFQMIYYHTSKLGIHNPLPVGLIFLIEAAPVVYMLMVYSIIVVLILSINSYLSLDKSNPQIVIIKTASSITLIVLLVVVMNAVVYFIIHNLPLLQGNGVFDGNLLKDPIKYFYRSSKPFSDCLWFSATTFFTVGYGDMHPVGNIMYLLSMIEMVSAYVLGIIMIPILLFKVSKS